MRLIPTALALLAFAGAAPAHAQVMLPRQDITRVTMQITIATPAQSGASSDEQLATQSDARKRIYTAIENECRVLAEVFKSDCRVAQVATNTIMGPRGPQQLETINLHGNGTFELVPRK
ncbi:hypothetical protein GCM10007036_04790 [Alsobacter metallidurans]|uniref:UrcA family protein n=1 Tax=Alsobacter metallidurans TaxID=340221 RepID=A0A917I4U6_9HYPH|nr:hypothetical protein [Alsobacter metallidurans]GGH09006.1 hypothetical protein GCM10007036_04790 [Alsobacter metallidurans]